MAIKGKKKSQSRGSQGQRRPAQAPRPTAGPRKRVPWYRTTSGRLIAGVLAVILIGWAIWAISNAHEKSAKLAKSQDQLESYTGDLRGILQKITSPAAAMQSAPTAAPDESTAKSLATSAKEWTKSLQAEVTEAQGIAPPGPVLRLNTLFQESIQLYTSASQTYELATAVKGKAATDLLTRAAEQRDRASEIWTIAASLLDEKRIAVDLQPSALRAPGEAPAQGPPTPSAVPSPVATQKIKVSPSG